MSIPRLSVLWTASPPSNNALSITTSELVRALSVSPIWETMHRGIIVYRTHPIPAIAVIGHFDEADLARLDFLSRWMAGAASSMTYIDWPKVTAAVEGLASQLENAFGPDLIDFDYAAIPRGGLIVLGLLSYALGLNRDLTVRSGDPGRPLVVVDDCALTGSRFKRFIDEHRNRDQIIFAHLCSTPQLRQAILEQEERVSHCLAHTDLEDLAPERMGDEYERWKRNVEVRAGEGRYWIGQASEVAFPWNEPDHNFWNPVTEATEWGWTIVPPEKCLKNARRASAAVPIHAFEPVPGDFDISAEILSAPFEDAVFVADVSSGKLLCLEGTGSEMWNSVVAGRSIADTAALIEQRYDVDIDRATNDVLEFTGQLSDVGILRRTADNRRPDFDL